MQIESRYVSVHVVPRSVSTGETKCFMPWNKVFQAMKHFVSYGETKCFKRLKLFETPVEVLWSTYLPD